MSETALATTEKLTPKQVQMLATCFAVLRESIVTSEPFSKVCERMGVSYTTFHRWFSSPLVQAEMSARLSTSAQQIVGMALPAIPAATRNLIEIACGKRGRASDQIAAFKELVKVLGLERPADLVRKPSDSFNEFLKAFEPKYVRVTELYFDGDGAPPVERDDSRTEIEDLPDIVEGELV